MISYFLPIQTVRDLKHSIIRFVAVRDLIHSIIRVLAVRDLIHPIIRVLALAWFNTLNNPCPRSTWFNTLNNPSPRSTWFNTPNNPSPRSTWFNTPNNPCPRSMWFNTLNNPCVCNHVSLRVLDKSRVIEFHVSGVVTGVWTLLMRGAIAYTLQGKSDSPLRGERFAYEKGVNDSPLFRLCIAYAK